MWNTYSQGVSAVGNGIRLSAFVGERQPEPGAKANGYMSVGIMKRYDDNGNCPR